MFLKVLFYLSLLFLFSQRVADLKTLTLYIFTAGHKNLRHLGKIILITLDSMYVLMMSKSSWVTSSMKTPEKGWRVKWLKSCEYNNKNKHILV